MDETREIPKRKRKYGEIEELRKRLAQLPVITISGEPPE
jgi:hypothetical protein